MVITYYTELSDGVTGVNAAGSLVAGPGGSGGPYNLSDIGTAYSVAAGLAGIVIRGDAVSMPAQGIQRISIRGKNALGDAWVSLLDTDYTTLPNAAAGTPLGDGLTGVDNSYYISGGRLKRDFTAAGGANYKPRYLAGTPYLFHEVRVICDSNEAALSATTAGHVLCINHLDIAAQKFHFGGYAISGSGTPSRVFKLGYANYGTDVSPTTMTVTANPGSGGSFGGGGSPLAFGTATGYPSVSGNTISIAAPTFTGGLTTPSWRWRYASPVDGTAVDIPGASGTGETITALSWTVPVELRNTPLAIWCEVTDGTSTLYLSRYASSQQTVRNLAQAPCPTVPDNSALSAIAAGIAFPVGQTVKILPFGDSISSSTNLAALKAILDAICPGKFATIPNSGHAGTRVEHWLRTTALGGDGSGVSVLDGAKNNFDGTIAAAAGHTGPVLVNFALGTNNNTFDSTLQTNLLQVWSDIRNAGYGIPGAIICAHTIPAKDTQYSEAAGKIAYASYLTAQATISGDAIYPGSGDLWAYFADNHDKITDGVHPSGTGSGSGQDALVRFWAKGLLQTLAVVYPGAPPDTTPPTVTAASINAAGTQITLTLSETTTGNTGFTVKVGGVTRAVVWGANSGTSIVGSIVAPTILSTDVVTLDYAAGNVQDSAGNALATITGRSVTNNSTQNGSGGGAGVTGQVVLPLAAYAGYGSGRVSHFRLQAYKMVGNVLTATGGAISGGWVALGSGLGAFAWIGVMGTEVPSDAEFLLPYLLKSDLSAVEAVYGLRSIAALQDWQNGVTATGGGGSTAGEVLEAILADNDIQRAFAVLGVRGGTQTVSAGSVVEVMERPDGGSITRTETTVGSTTTLVVEDD